MVITALPLALLSSSPAMAADPWDKTEISMEIMYMGLSVIDWRQTLDIENHHDLHETCPLLGDHPSNKRINAWFATGLILQPIAAHYIPDVGRKMEEITGLSLHSEQWRKAWIGGGICIELRCTANNYRLGIACKF